MMSDRRTLHRFYCSERLEAGRTFHLPLDVTDQIRRVLRMNVGDTIMLFDGGGREATGTLRALGPEQAAVELIEEPTIGRVAPKPEMHLGMSLLKGDRFDLVVQKATELGVSSIVPLVTARCVVSLSADRARKRTARWRRIAIEALEQSGRSDTVHVSEPVPFEQAVDAMPGEKRLIAWEMESRRSLVSSVEGHEEAIALLIGPEGGFTENELQIAGKAGCIPVSLGELTLRSETAAIAAIVTIRAAFDIRREISAEAREE